MVEAGLRENHARGPYVVCSYVRLFATQGEERV
jgi:hypothetical protein